MQEKYDKQAILKVLEYLYRIEPKCSPCEQCSYGYYFKEKDKIACKKEKEKIQKEWEEWHKKIVKWQRRYNYE